MEILDGVAVRKYTDIDNPFVYEVKKMQLNFIDRDMIT